MYPEEDPAVESEASQENPEAAGPAENRAPGIDSVDVTLRPTIQASGAGASSPVDSAEPRSVVEPALPPSAAIETPQPETSSQPAEPARPLYAEGNIPGGKGRAIYLPRPKGWPPLGKAPEPYLPSPPAIPAWALEQEDSGRDPRVFPPAVKRPEEPMSEAATANVRLRPTADGGPPLARPIVLVTLATDQMHSILEAALRAAGQRDAKRCGEIAEQQVNLAFFKFRAEQRVLWRR